MGLAGRFGKVQPDALGALRARDVMTPDPVTIHHDAHLSDAAELMETRNIRHLPVVVGGKLTALLSERHIRDALPSIHTLKDPTARRRALALTRVDQVALHNPTTMRDDASMLEIIQVMRNLHAGSLPVVNGAGTLVGILTSGDLINLLEAILRSSK